MTEILLNMKKGHKIASHLSNCVGQERRRARVVRSTRLCCRSPEGREFEPGRRHPTTEKSVNPTINR